MVYDGFDRPVERRFPRATGGTSSSPVDVEEFVHDANSNVTQRITRDGRAIGFTYDALGRVTMKDVAGTTQSCRAVKP